MFLQGTKELLKLLSSLRTVDDRETLSFPHLRVLTDGYSGKATVYHEVHKGC